MPSINNFLKGVSDGLPGMKDYQHASRLYIDDNFKLLPKQKFLFHVYFDVDDNAFTKAFNTTQKLELNMLVKNLDLPKYNFNLEEKQQYNKKTYVSTRMSYEPVNINFHDDHADTVNAFWKAYYEYNNVDSITVASTGLKSSTKDTLYDSKGKLTRTQFGMDGKQRNKKPLLRSIQIFVLHKQKFTSFTLINPRIASFSHDSLDQAEGGGVMSNAMQVFYETVLYSAGTVNKASIPGFSTIHYDHEPSPISALGGGTTSIFGPGGIVDGIGSVIGDITTGNIGVGTILKGINTYNNAKKIKAKDAVKEELKGIVKEGVLGVSKQAGTITNPIGNFSIGNVAQSIAVGAAAATAYGMIDENKNKNRKEIITNYTVDIEQILSPSESFNAITTNEQLKDQAASGIYYKLIGSRQGLTVAESDLNYANLIPQQKEVYRSRALTDITKLVNEGYIKINRDTLDITIVTEKANI